MIERRDEKGRNHFLVRTFRSIMCALLLVTMVSCTNNPPANQEDPNAAVKNFFQALKNADLTKAQDYLVSKDETLKFESERHKEVSCKVFSMMSWELNPNEVNGDTATVKVKVTTPVWPPTIVGGHRLNAEGGKENQD